ncbi:hypothetical protein TraAM80_08186 [Trypanosoma rangeli]|uniref:Uncharacterized protein n=1 Tax=Trypanosoma rangeli TaxID=5698 RepID=A0A422N238_TRYRA|nr:uncharacterized protein TraAM80_08186 [Trypanosoma rangeli]RNE99521.1 hypothetical protein TraAM80_08186 [Trypanosoma rangeli]|eukprot:RNE99521.1 hypothetical protein TraAM80_08186 [Trypanosoma rangeli]
MQQWRVRRVSFRVDWLLCGVGLMSERRSAASSRLWCAGRQCAGHALSHFSTEGAASEDTNSIRRHCLNGSQTASAVDVSFSPKRGESKRLAPLLKPEAAETRASSSAWDLQQMLFGIRDFHTRAVTYVEAEERLRGMRLLDECMIQKLFLDSGWVRQLQDSAETAPQYRGVVGEYKILRHMLHGFLSDETMWRDDLLNLLELLLGAAVQSVCPLSHRDASQHTAVQPGLLPGDNSACGNNNDNNMDALPLNLPASLFTGPEKMNFYSYGLQHVLWDFLHVKASSRGSTSALWLAFVASHRNLLSLPSPQRPPFSRYESHSGLLGVEFVEVTDTKQLGKSRENPITLAGEAAPHASEAWKLPNDGQAAASGDEEDAETTTALMVDNELGKPYLRDRFYMNVVEPGEVSFLMSETTPGDVLSRAHKEHKEERGSHALAVSWRGERELLNPVNGELEDIHLTHLWGVFQAMTLEDSIDMYRAVYHGDLEKLQEEVFMDVLARTGLLMLFFARDEVRALTPPHMTFRRLSRLYQELTVLVSWASTNDYRPLPPPPSFDQLTLSAQLSFSCFAQLHAPVQRELYRSATTSMSPAQLYYCYCKSHLRFAVQPTASLQDDNNEDADKTLLGERSVVMGHRKFPTFECLSELQQMAFQYPFQDAVPHSSPQKNIERNLAKDELMDNAATHQSNTTELIPLDVSESAPAVRRCGRPRKTAQAEPDVSEESAPAVRRCGRPRKTALPM